MRSFGGTIAFVLLAVRCSVWPSTSTTYSFTVDVVASGGHSSTSSTYTFLDSAGQSAIGCSTSAKYTACAGFLSLEGGEFLSDATYSAGLLGASDGKGVAWGDFDADGAMDFYVSRGSVATNDQLFQNAGSVSFTEVAAEKGIEDIAAGTGAGWVDADADGKLDMYVRNAEGTTGALYRSAGSLGFTNVTPSAGLTAANVGASGGWGDYDGDGLPDLFMASTNGALPHLYRNKGAGLFERVDSAVGLTKSTWGSGVWGDFDNDGDLDIFVAQHGGQTDLLYENLDGTGFVEVAATHGLTNVASSP